MITDKEKENQAYRLLSSYCKYLEDCRVRYAPRSPEEHPHPLFVLSLLELEHFRYYCDIFISSDSNERQAFIEEQGELLDRLSSLFSKNAA
jgi:hypothetical protein